MTSILIVEDEITVQTYLKKNLSRFYHVVATAVSGEEAIELAEEHLPDIVLMDITLKGKMDGIEAASIIVEKFDIPILFITAQNDDKTLERAKLTKPFGYILKPVDFSVLKTNIEIAVRMYSQLTSTKRSQQTKDSNQKESPKEGDSYLDRISKNVSESTDPVDMKWTDKNRIEIVNNKFLRQYWILESTENEQS